jgi:hypothetical protein
VFESKVFSELKNAQSIVLAYEGVNPLPESYCRCHQCYTKQGLREKRERGGCLAFREPSNTVGSNGSYLNIARCCGPCHIGRQAPCKMR